eukprot:441767-Rhodomonas_salina.4
MADLTVPPPSRPFRFSTNGPENEAALICQALLDLLNGEPASLQFRRQRGPSCLRTEEESRMKYASSTTRSVKR